MEKNFSTADELEAHSVDNESEDEWSEFDANGITSDPARAEERIVAGLLEEAQQGKISLKDLRSAFDSTKSFDANDNGFISNKELLAQLNEGTANPKDKSIARMLHQHQDVLPEYSNDANPKNGAKSEKSLGISENDVKAFVKATTEDVSLFAALETKFADIAGRHLYEKLDLNGDGQINQTELANVQNHHSDAHLKEIAKHGSKHYDEIKAAKKWDTWSGNATVSDFHKYYSDKMKNDTQSVVDTLWSLDGTLQGYASGVNKLINKYFDTLTNGKGHALGKSDLEYAVDDLRLSSEQRFVAKFLHDNYDVLFKGGDNGSKATGVTRGQIAGVFDALNPARIREHDPARRQVDYETRESLVEALGLSVQPAFYPSTEYGKEAVQALVNKTHKQ